MRRFARTALVALALSGCASESPPKLATVSDFDVDRYLGQWHQVAAIPAWFQADCAGNTRASYSKADDGLLRVVNACDAADGTEKQAEARARFVGEPAEGRLEVTFVTLFGDWFWPAAGDYWVVALDPDYRWSLVGEPSREFAWVLARERTLERHTLVEIDAVLRRAGYDSCALRLTAPGLEGRLCDLAG